MAETPKKPKNSPSNPKLHSPFSALSIPPTPSPVTPRRSLRRIPPTAETETLRKPDADVPTKPRALKTLKSDKKGQRSRRESKKLPSEPPFSPISPDLAEPMKRKRSDGKIAPRSASRASRMVCFEREGVKRRTYYKKVVYDGGEFGIGDDVYVKRREDASSDGEDPEVEECRICFKSGKAVIIECDDCLGGFHMRCLRPPLKEVPEGVWICKFCEGRRTGKKVEFPRPPEGKRLSRTAREKLLSSDLWAAHIER
ncbi:origin of replication complex subunit 1-like [Magnolia sinica]|uniref:origin of replication complex subunit 1-like n=1 Tax=Magnolia sinica TaxID=86752 RepID=UPI0026596F80|nr:origin of replication complex subunit 1-like [Magnolia sinica]